MNKRAISICHNYLIQWGVDENILSLPTVLFQFQGRSSCSDSLGFIKLWRNHQDQNRNQAVLQNWPATLLPQTWSHINVMGSHARLRDAAERTQWTGQYVMCGYHRTSQHPNPLINTLLCGATNKTTTQTHHHQQCWHITVAAVRQQPGHDPAAILTALTVSTLRIPSSVVTWARKTKTNPHHWNCLMSSCK